MKKNIPTIIIIGLIVLVIAFVIYAISRPESADKTKTNSTRPKVEADVSKLSQGNSQGPADAKVSCLDMMAN